MRNALGSIPAIDLAAAYGVEQEGDTVVVGAITLLEGYELTQADLESAMRGLDAAQRPSYVRVVADLPVTTWARPLWRPLQAQGLPDPRARANSCGAWHRTVNPMCGCEAAAGRNHRGVRGGPVPPRRRRQLAGDRPPSCSAE